MKKLTAGLVAAGTGVVLLAAGIGSYALWSDSATVDAGPVDSGVMTIAAVDGAWNPEITLWVPGDTTTYTTNLTITLAGDNLDSQLAIDSASITGDPDLLAALDIDLTIGAITGGGTATPTGAPNTFTLASATPTVSTVLTVPVTVTVDFPENSVTDQTAQDESVDLSGIEFTLTQIAP